MSYDPDFAFLDKPLKPAPGLDFAYLDKSRPGPPPIRKWALVYIANLPSPLVFGLAVTTAIGAVGMCLGVLVLFLMGRWACFVARELVLTVVYGGWVVAAFQFMPVGQIAAGFVGVGVVKAVGMAHPDLGPIDTALGGFVATIVTGSLLVFAAAALGLALRG